MDRPTSAVARQELRSPRSVASSPAGPSLGKEFAPLHEAEQEQAQVPKILNSSSLPKTEIEKIRRICTHKRGSGKLEVPENIFEMWEDAAKGRDTIFRMWAKAGGIKAGRLIGSISRNTRIERCTCSIFFVHGSTVCFKSMCVHMCMC